MPARKIVIIGGVAGGATAAARARRTDELADIVVLEKGPYISFANCGLPYYIGREIGDRSALLLMTPEGFKSKFNVEVRILHEALSIDRKRKVVRVREVSSGTEYEEHYDQLVLSPGATPIRPPLPGINLPNVYTLRTVPDSDAIKAHLEEHGASRAVVVGAGFIGLEMVENLQRLGLQVTLIEKMDQVLPPMDPEMASFVTQQLQQMGIEVILGDGIAGFEGEGRADAVRLESGLTVPGEIFILGLGVRPDTRMAREAGLATGSTGAISVDDHMRTSDPDIFAAGDAVETVNLATGRPAWIPLAGPSNKQGRVAGANAAGDDLTFPGALATAIVRVGSVTAAVTGLSEKAARKAGIDVWVSYTVSGDHADYYPGAQEMMIKIIAESGTGRLLGAQTVGGNGVDKRTDVFATAIAGRLTVADLTNLDLAYAPPFGAAKDPAIVAGMLGQNLLRGQVKAVTPSQLVDALGQESAIQVVDVRQPYEFEMGALPGAVNIPLEELRERLGELDPARETVVCDVNGKHAYWAARMLTGRGFGSVRVLTGGYMLWSGYSAGQ